MSYNKTISALIFGYHQDLSTLESDVHLGFSWVNITVLRLTNTDGKLKRMHQLYDDNEQSMAINPWVRNMLRQLSSSNDNGQSIVINSWGKAHVPLVLQWIKHGYTTARVFALRIRVSCAFPTHCTCVEFKLRMKRVSTYFETHEYSLAAL